MRINAPERTSPKSAQPSAAIQWAGDDKLPVGIAPIVRAATRPSVAASPEIAAESVALELENDPPAVDLLMNPTRLAHVFYNIINNACDAMPDGGKVRLRFEQSDREILTEIEDTGRGIAPEIASSLFEAFATYGKAQGTGLGLSICKKIVEDHHGRIGSRSDPGRGAVFYFSLPLRAEAGDKA